MSNSTTKDVQESANRIRTQIASGQGINPYDIYRVLGDPFKKVEIPIGGTPTLNMIDLNNIERSIHLGELQIPGV